MKNKPLTKENINGESNIINFKFPLNSMNEQSSVRVSSLKKDPNRNEYCVTDLEEGNLMDNESLEKFLNKIDQDRRDQEERLSKNYQLMEQRITEERRLSEERIEKRIVESEQRMEKKFIEAMNSIKDTNNKIDDLRSKLDDKTDKMLEKIDSTNKWIIGLCISTILGVAAIATAVAIFIFQSR